VSIVSLGLMFGVFVPILFKQIPPLPKLSSTLGLMLGMIMIALQMGLSFHLYSRRILGYSFVASTISIGVAAGLIHDIGIQHLAIWFQNIAFLLLFCKFVAIAISTLMLDYRSRLALPPISIQSAPPSGELPYQHLPWKYLTRLAAMVIGLGMVLSIFAPNFRLPNLSFKPNNLDQLQTLAQKYRPPNSNPPSAPDPTNNPNLPPQNLPPAAQQALASKVFGQPGNNNYPDAIKQDYLQLPPEVAGQIQQFTQKILATSPQPLKSDFDRSTYLAEYLKQHHQDTPTANSANLPPLDPQLIQQLIANCTATPQSCKMVGNQQDLPVVYTSMLRSIGIPARLKTGDQLAQIDPNTKLYPRPENKQSSQTEVYSPNWGWFGLDATPEHPIVNLTAQQLAQLQTQAQQLGLKPDPSAQPRPNPATPSNNAPNNAPTDLTKSIDNPANNPANNPNDLTKSIDNSFNNPSDYSSSPPPLPELPKDLDLTAFKIIIVMLAIGGGIAWYLIHKSKEQQQLATLPPIERIYRSMIISLSKTGNSKTRSQTQLEYAHSIKTTEHPQIAKVVAEISQLYIAWRYGKEKIDIQHLARKLQNLQHLQQLAADRQRQQWITQQKLLWLGNNKKPPIK
jgi:Transglutaminase-like superfamily